MADSHNRTFTVRPTHKTKKSHQESTTELGSDEIREMFPRLQNEIFLNAAGGIPQSSFARQAVRDYDDFWSLGPGDASVLNRE